jgi:hypothetical protein
MLQSIVIRSIFAGVGVVGVASIIPNVMMNDSGNNSLGSKTGLFASGLFIASGVAGVIHNAYLPIIIGNMLGVAGLITQLAAFAM